MNNNEKKIGNLSIESNGAIVLGDVRKLAGAAYGRQVLQYFNRSNTNLKISNNENLYFDTELGNVEVDFGGSGFDNTIELSGQSSTQEIQFVNVSLNGERKIRENNIYYWISPRNTIDNMIVFRPSNLEPTFDMFRNGGMTGSHDSKESGSTSYGGLGFGIKRDFKGYNVGLSHGNIRKDPNNFLGGAPFFTPPTANMENVIFTQAGIENQKTSLSAIYTKSAPVETYIGNFRLRNPTSLYAGESLYGLRLLHNISNDIKCSFGYDYSRWMNREAPLGPGGAEGTTMQGYMGGVKMSNNICGKDFETGLCIGKKLYVLNASSDTVTSLSSSTIPGQAVIDKEKDNINGELYIEYPVSPLFSIRFTLYYFYNGPSLNSIDANHASGWVCQLKNRITKNSNILPEGGKDEDLDLDEEIVIEDNLESTGGNNRKKRKKKRTKKKGSSIFGSKMTDKVSSFYR